MRLRLIGTAQSRAFRCIWMLEELQVSYELIPLMPAAKDVFRYNMTGKIPVLLVNEDGNETQQEPTYTVSESAIINTFLGDRFPNSGLVPKFSTDDRLVYDQLVMSIMTELDATALWNHRKHTVLGKFFGYIPEIEKASLLQFNRINGSIAIKLEQSGGPFLLGKQFTAADILYGHCLDWARMNGWGESFQSDTIDAYIKAYRERPAYIRAKEIRSAETKRRPADNSFETKSNL